MQLLTPFDQFDPFEGVPTHHYFDKAETILTRSRRLLAGRSREQIVYMVETINYMLAYRDPLSRLMDTLDDEEPPEITPGSQVDDDSSRPETLNRQSGTPGADLRSHPENWIYSPTETLYGLMQHFDIDNQTEVPDAVWSEYFVSLALALVGESVQVPKGIRQGAEIEAIEGEWRSDRHVANCLMDAMEALGKAELIRERETEHPRIKAEAARAVTEKNRLERQSGAIAIHAETNQIKYRFIRFVEDSVKPSLPPGQTLNRSAAVREFIEEFLTDQAPEGWGPPHVYSGRIARRTLLT